MWRASEPHNHDFRLHGRPVHQGDRHYQKYKHSYDSSNLLLRVLHSSIQVAGYCRLMKQDMGVLHSTLPLEQGNNAVRVGASTGMIDAIGRGCS